MNLNQKGFANIVLVIVIVLVIGAVGYFAFIKRSSPIAQQPTPSQANNTVSPAQIQQNETATWKDYKSNFGYTIKYPTDWQYKVLSSDIVCFGKEVKIVEQDIEGGRPTRCDGDHILVWAEPGSKTDLEGTIKSRREINPNVEVKHFIIDGVQAITIYGQSRAETFFSSNNGTGYTITLNMVSNQNNSSWRIYYESMLSTFRFVP